MGKATTIRFTDEVFARLDQASSWTGMPVNSIVVAACLEWMSRHAPDPSLPVGTFVAPAGFAVRTPGPPRWATIRRAVVQAVTKGQPLQRYPFANFTATAQALLASAQAEAERSGVNYIGTEHLLLAAFANAQSDSARVLRSLDVAEAKVRSALEEKLGTEKPTNAKGSIPTSRVKKVIELAFELSATAGAERVSTAHVLLALAAEGKGIAAHVLNDFGATRNRIDSAIDELTETED